MFDRSPPPQAGGTPIHRPKAPTALGGFAVCVAAPIALLCVVPIWTLTAAPVFDFISNSQPAIFALIGQFVWVGAVAFGIFFLIAGLIQTIFSALGARLKMSLFNFNFRGSRR